MLNISYDDQVNRIGQLGAFAPGTYTCNCVTCKNTFMGDKRASQCLACTVTALVRMNTEFYDLLKKHHDWQCEPGLEMKLGDEYFDCASCYCDSTLEEATTSALSVWPIIHMPPSKDD